MINNKLDVILAMQDDQFQKILQSDEILKKLDEEKFNPQLQFFQLMDIFNGKYIIHGVQCGKLTLAIWCFLYCIGNAYAKGKRAEKIDTAVFVYLLANGLNAIDDDIYTNATAFAEENNLPLDLIQQDLLAMIARAFQPFRMLPTTASNNSKEQPKFNVEWVTSIVSIVSKSVNENRHYILYEMGINEALYYVVNHCKENDVKGLIRKRNTDEIDAEILKRTMELGEKYYNDNYVKKDK